MGNATPSFSLSESLTILDEALYLLRTPERWTRGFWKCEVFETDKEGNRVRDYNTTSGYKQKMDKDGKPLFAYCIEGAVNQAVINKFGEARAEQVGALRMGACPINGEYTNSDLDTGEAGATELLSVNDIVIELYADEYSHYASLDSSERPAQSLNDNSAFDEASTYERIINALRTKRDRVARALAGKLG